MIETILYSHLARYPAIQIQDVYKLLHQAALGCEHAVPNLELARDRLRRELAEMGTGPPEPLVDPISPDGKIARIHLRPFVETGHTPYELLAAFIRTANEYHGDVRLLEGYWQAAMATEKFPAKEMTDFFQSLQEKSYPALHHSAPFEDLYRPAYRVVALMFCPDPWVN